MSIITLFYLALVKTLFHLYLLERCSNSELTEQNNPAVCGQDSYSSILGVLHLRERNKDLEEGEVRSKDRVEVINL